MRKNRRFMKLASMAAVGGMMFQFGGCGGFFPSTFRNFPVGFGRGLGSNVALLINAALVAPFVQPLIDQFAGANNNAG
jgi:hypothetical protein